MSVVQIASLARQIRRGDIRACASAISIFEDQLPSRNPLKKHLIQGRAPRAFLVGVTGPAGAGKSTLIAGLAQAARRAKKKVAVIAVDPTSPKHGGAFLGDRVRMQSLAEDPGVFIRSMASRGARGGIAAATCDAAMVLARAGYELIFIETVGAGQLDDQISGVADLTVLVLTPEGGDQIQMMKGGLVEIADVLVVNKADRPGAGRMAHLFAHDKRPVFQTVAEERKGIGELYAVIAKHASKRS